MSMAIESTHIAQIGEAAGMLWKFLDEHGPTPLARLVKDCELPRDLLMQALGWLAREDKLTIEEERRAKIVSLR